MLRLSRLVQATWLRSLIKPEPGTALAYVDFSSQEMGIAAALSGGPSTRALLRELAADQEPDQADQERERSPSGAELARSGSDN